MITPYEPRYLLSDNMFQQAKEIIDRSGVPGLIEQYYCEEKSAGGRESSGIAYTMTAVLVGALSLIMLTRKPSIKAILNAIADLSPGQLAAVGMAGQDTSRIFGSRVEQRRERQRFTAWLCRRLQPLDPSPDQPARRIPNAEHHRIVAARTSTQRADYAAAATRLEIVINDLIKGSIQDPQPSGSVGDLVADESIFHLAGPSSGLGSRPEKNRGAAYFGKYYVRERSTGTIDGDDRRIGKRGYAIGVTTITRVGAGTQVHAVAPVILAAHIGHPSSGDPAALRVCIEHMRRNGLDTRPPGQTTWPRFTVDMGYSVKKDFPWLMFEQKYTGVFWYPETTTLTEPSQQTEGPKPRPQGPVQFAGAFYCPAVEPLLGGHRLQRTRDLLATNGWERHDAKLRAILPFLMGTNTRPFLGRSRGRPRLGALPGRQVKVELVCPAVQGRVQCPLKPASMDRAAFGTPLATPTWQAQDRQCCAHSPLTLTLTPAQFQKAQWGPVATSWDHVLSFEAERSLTEQRYSLLKSPYVTGITEMTWGPRREPLVKILLALAIAATNHRIQQTHQLNGCREESIDIRMRQLHDHLGHEPARTPPRT